MKIKNNTFAVLPYNSKKILDKFLVSTQFGGWSLLDRDDFRKLNSLGLCKDSILYNRLKKDGVVISDDNIAKVIGNFRDLHRNWFTDTGLHIIVLNEDCNFDCVYCQVKRKQKKNKMTLKVATKILEFVFCSKNPNVRLEFQGGEPLMEWETLCYIVKSARRQNKFERKNLEISVVTNMSLLDNQKIDFLIKHDVEVCTSLDGPQELHDRNRVFYDGKGTYKAVVGGIKKLKKKYASRSIKRAMGALPTITRQSLDYSRELVDEYVELGFKSIHLRPLNKLGNAQAAWPKIGYTPEEFNNFWAKTLDYIITINKKGKLIQETFTSILLRKLIKKQDPLYVDCESPCGAGRSQIAYTPTGDVYTCDEARMQDKDLFRLGNVLKDKYEEVMKSQNIFYTCQASFLNLWDYNSAFSPWLGTCPVLNYYHQANPVVKITQTSKYKIYNFQLDYIFKKMITDKKAAQIFNRWAEN